MSFIYAFKLLGWVCLCVAWQKSAAAGRKGKTGTRRSHSTRLQFIYERLEAWRLLPLGYSTLSFSLLSVCFFIYADAAARVMRWLADNNFSLREVDRARCETRVPSSSSRAFLAPKWRTPRCCLPSRVRIPPRGYISRSHGFGKAMNSKISEVNLRRELQVPPELLPSLL